MNPDITPEGLDLSLPVLAWMRTNRVRRFAVDGIEWEIELAPPDEKYRLALCKLKADWDDQLDIYDSVRDAFEVLR